MSLLTIKNLQVGFPTRHSTLLALRGISFDVHPAEIVGVLGESGCGKTTTALAILGLLPATATCAGSIGFQRQELLGCPEHELESIRGAQISLISQEPALALNPVLSVRRQLREVLRAHKNDERADGLSEIHSMLERVGLSDTARISSAYPHQLSGGQRQRVAIAQALACKPNLVIADEPTASLDAGTQAEILELFVGLRQSLQCAFLFISHNPAILQRICDRILVMYAGEIIEQGPAARVLNDPLHPYTRALLQCAPTRPSRAGKRRRSYIPGSAPNLQHPIPGCAFESRCPDRMEICTMRAPIDLKTNLSRHVRCFKFGG
jgi:oligopeptide/dipeptide ABC transporter ATP-binding protein